MKDHLFQEVFDAVDPAKGLDDAQLDAKLPAERMFQRIQDQLSSKPVPWFRRRPWRRAAIISTTAILVIAGSAAAITFLRSPVTNSSGLSCYSQDSLHSKVIAEFSYRSHPLALCQSELKWKPEKKGATPSGFLCVLSNGTLAGFPPSKEAESCAKLGLAVFNGKLKYPRVLAFENSADQYFSKNQCVSISAARAHVLLLLGRFGLVGWRIHTGGSSAPRACATFGIQVDFRIVDVVGIVR